MCTNRERSVWHDIGRHMFLYEWAICFLISVEIADVFTLFNLLFYLRHGKEVRRQEVISSLKKTDTKVRNSSRSFTLKYNLRFTYYLFSVYRLINNPKHIFKSKVSNRPRTTWLIFPNHIRITKLTGHSGNQFDEHECTARRTNKATHLYSAPIYASTAYSHQPGHITDQVTRTLKSHERAECTYTLPT